MMDFLRESWKFLTSGPIYPLYVGIGFTAVMLLAATINDIMRKRRVAKEAPPKDPDVQFLEEALESEPEHRQTDPNYAWDDLQRDLHDGKITFNAIWEKCGGRLPRKPIKREPSRGPAGQDGGLSYEGPAGSSGVRGQADEEPHQGVNLKRLVGECPSKWKDLEPELPIWVKCCTCIGNLEYAYPRVCRMCGGTGYVIERET